MLSSSISSTSRPPLFPMLRKKPMTIITKIFTSFHYFKTVYLPQINQLLSSNGLSRMNCTRQKSVGLNVIKKLEVGVDKQRFQQIDCQVYRQNGINSIMNKDQNQQGLKKRQTEFTAQLQTAIRHWYNQLLEKLKNWKNSLDSLKHRGFFQNFTAF